MPDGERRARPAGSEGTVKSYAASLARLIEYLLADAAAHERERYDEVGRRFDATERDLPRGDAAELTKLRIALTFWDSWIDARNRGWPTGDAVAKAEWPQLARIIAEDLSAGRDIAHALVCEHFDSSSPSASSNRVRILAARLSS